MSEEGGCGDFQLTEISEATFPNVLIFLREHFFPNEPCAKALDLCPHGYTQVPEDGDQGSQEIGEDDKEKIKCLGNPVKLEKLYKFFDDLTMNYGKSSIFEELNVKEVLDIFILCTSDEMSGRGVGTALVKESLDVAKRQKLPLVTCMALSAFSNRICVKLDFKKLFSVDYGSYTQDGTTLFEANKMKPHTEGVLLYKLIQQV
ncbi:hypothetical protein TCAL_12539 [Tigriopus californicus]|uniref:N-acetyltransferase domain-containing protein n=1 Tax=Tigriopus californicus TaxID=6832 RepID=A0A553PTD4_TIGCA|nr:hypothetical protein TCAL_12539 [Tigriopus californicus]|eukprot:TCALIF_12539-PA protein Name:"Protein of unknown function" AED:0.14 eAED:0.14 QI:0/0.66/0.5/0.75/1/1/4/77/202